MSEARALNVLIVEDDPGDALLIRRLLERARDLDCRVEVRDRIASGLERLDAGGVDVVLLDFSLPDSLGLDTFRRMRDRHPELPVLILTSLDDDALAVRAVAEGAQDYLVKRQVDARLLARAIRYAIERQRGESALRASEERYALAVRGANDGLWDWDRGAGTVYLSPRWKAMLGYREEEVGDRPGDWFSRVAEDDREKLRSALEAHVGSSEPHFELEHRMMHRDGREIWVLTRGVVVRGASGAVTRMAGSMTDISARKQIEAQLLHDAFHDGLTGLANRSLFLDRLSVALAGRRRGRQGGFAVLFLDLDRFKNVNDSLGHGVGDRLLVEIGQRLVQLMRPSDTVARLGGDEFAVLAGGVRDSAGAAHIAERIREGLAQPFSIDGQEVFASASIGIALPNREGPSAEGLLRDADLAMYRAKAAGRGCYEVFDLELHTAAVQLLKLETELRRAVAAGDFVMHYQPIVSLGDGRIVGFEALTRWKHPDRGLVAPAHFIALAEETGLVVPLGWFVLDSACRQARDWQERFPSDPPIFMSVNVSGKLFAQEGAVEQVLRVLESARLAPESLRLEVTESVVLDHGETVMRQLRMLRGLGVQLSIDDFGTGYSSLSYLQRFRYDSLKIDRSFVRDIEINDSRVIIETILSLASHLGIGVVAEGVETEEQLRRLRTLGCPLGQGFWFAHPLEVASAERLLATGVTW
ncbi:MAG: EAL domain-containing protein [Thermoanaerobaculia bacterium]|nr:MAG: EAL domain-containing protein [Thermoanaerobaculia bacterium]